VRRRGAPSALAAVLVAFVLAAGCGSDDPGDPGQEAAACEPTAADALGPFYEPGAPVRDEVGTGYVLSGRVVSSRDCRPLPDAEIELWLVGPDGRYDDAHRATLPVDAGGEYRFESNKPVGYEGRPPHIHLRITAPGHPPLVTQHYPDEGPDEARFDITMPSS
jgi:protocatechuate 3,4-dioxygenase beta subunit